MSIFDDIDISQRADEITRNFTDRDHSTPDVQSGYEASDKLPTNLKNALDTGGQEIYGRSTHKGGEPIRLMQDGQDTRPRADKFTPPGEWVSPVEIQRRRSALALPSANQITDLEQRLDKVHRFGGLPKEAVKPSNEARLAIGAAREAFLSAQHPEQPRSATSLEAKDNVVLLIAKATASVGAFETLMAEAPVQEAHYETLVENIDEQREEALEALRAAKQAYGALRSAIQSADALARQQGRWDDAWHQSPAGTEKDLNEPLEQIARAIDWLAGEDDYASGRYLTKEYEAFPPHTVEVFARKADLSNPNSWWEQVHKRMADPSPNDAAAQDAIKAKQMGILYEAQSWEEAQGEAKLAQALRALGGYGESGSNSGAGSVIL